MIEYSALIKEHGRLHAPQPKVLKELQAEARKRKLWASSINSSVILELSGIMLAAVVGPMFSASAPFVYDFGGQEETSALLVSVGLQLAAEVVVDGVALWVEAGHGLPVDRYFTWLNDWKMVHSQYWSVLMGVLWGGLYRCVSIQARPYLSFPRLTP